MKNALKHILLFVILLISFTLIFTVKWAYDTFGNLTLEEIVFNLKVPLEGTNVDYYYDYLTNVLTYIIGTTTLVFVLLLILFKKRKNKKPKGKRMKVEEDNKLIIYKRFKMDLKYTAKFVICIVIMVTSITYATNKTNLIEYISYQLTDSDFIENEYVDPRTVSIKEPEQKRNLIYIFLESMEATYFSKENGGAFEQSLIPELEQLALENVSFSNSDKLKGSYTLPGSTWTAGAMVTQTAGLPLKISIDGNSYGSYDKFLPGVYSLGNLLQDLGYEQMLMVGSDVNFGGRSNYFGQHGDFDFFDLNVAIEQGRMTEEEKVWWGFDDSDLFEYAKEYITSLAEQSTPFNFTMLTVDTHQLDGYVCELCEDIYDEQYYNVLACSSKQVAAFVEWIQAQDFYENTTIVIAGDHLTMQPETFDHLDSEGYERTTLNIFINSAVEPAETKNRGNSTLDMFPTTMASLGFEIEGERLGLGTNLFSTEQTILGRYGLDYVSEELQKSSRYYNKTFIYD